MSEQDELDSTHRADQVAEESGVEDDAATDGKIPNVRYDITSYGADLDVEGLIRRLDRNEILIPPFQRGYVWRLPEASRFVESLLLGLPVPGVFFAREQETNRFLVIDGQQRLKTLQFFRQGYFNPREGETRRRVFALENVQAPFESKTYEQLPEPDRIRLDSSIIHATIVRQDAPPKDDTSIYHIFERLNSAGRVLTAQEIRTALYHGPFLELLRDLNASTPWRAIFGAPNLRLKDQELILRFLALLESASTYQRPMSEFLNKFAATHQNADMRFCEATRESFASTINLIFSALGREAFRPVKALNAAVFDAVMVGLATRVRASGPPSVDLIRAAYVALLEEPSFVEATSRSTADEAFVRSRLAVAISAFSA